MMKAEICNHLVPQKVLCSIKTTQIIFLIYSETSNLTAITNNEKNQIEGERSQKRTASIIESSHQEKRV